MSSTALALFDMRFAANRSSQMPMDFTFNTPVFYKSVFEIVNFLTYFRAV